MNVPPTHTAFGKRHLVVTNPVTKELSIDVSNK